MEDLTNEELESGLEYLIEIVKRTKNINQQPKDQPALPIKQKAYRTSSIEKEFLETKIVRMLNALPREVNALISPIPLAMYSKLQESVLQFIEILLEDVLRI
ncbi:19904_t:CDS:2 [Gigaspora margarita]|uniref:19904_t:CDS:1 n=1 Tax=Gigaspora margarita TaxID=4874 RepID=A0ABN7UPR5_GIGMA|nr:19904_t:CDS:2 [Gigaspora margarita]